MNAFIVAARIRIINKFTIKTMYKPGTKFVSTQYISEEMYERGVFPGASYRTAIARVGIVMKEHWKFPVYAQKATGAIFMVPEEWWKMRKGHGGTQMTCGKCPDKVTTKKMGRWTIHYNHRCGIDSGVIWDLEKTRADCPLGLE